MVNRRENVELEGEVGSSSSMVTDVCWLSVGGPYGTIRINFDVRMEHVELGDINSEDLLSSSADCGETGKGKRLRGARCSSPEFGRVPVLVLQA